MIAIDGPVGSGKGTLAVALANRLDALYIYTGGMYRALALVCLQQNVDVHDEEKVLDLLGKISIELKLTNLDTRVFLDGIEVSDEIFKPEVTKATPIVSAFSSVRKEMVKRQREMIKDAAVVVEGRDIATDVLPSADVKIYLTADIRIRAQRRLKQLEKRGIKINIDEVRRDVEERDRMDTTRLASPLTITSDAYVLDTTNLTIEETVEKVMDKLRAEGLI